MSTVKTTNITHASNSGTENLVLASNGNVTIAAALSAGSYSGLPALGKVLQVTSSAWKGVTSSTSTSFVEISSNLRKSITPSSTNSKILVTSCLNTASNNSRQTYRMYRSIGGGAYSEASEASADGSDNDDGMYNLYTNSEAFMKMNSFTFIDEPSTTSAVIYTPYWSVSGGTVYMNQDNDGSGTNKGVSTMTLMEIAG